MYKEDLGFNSLQVLICHKTKPNQAIPKFYMDKKKSTFENGVFILFFYFTWNLLIHLSVSSIFLLSVGET